TRSTHEYCGKRCIIDHLTLKWLEGVSFDHDGDWRVSRRKGGAMLKIGEFSKLVQVSVPTLRYYDQVGLLKPVEVDRSTGYRYYSASQLPRLHRILALKGLGFSLEQIAGVLAEGLTPEQMRGMLRLRHAQISQQLTEMQSQLVEVEVRLQQIEREDAISSYD